jgi:hypothetical protein
MKTCTKCHADKPLDAFHARHTGKGKVQSWCKVCTNTFQRVRGPKYQFARRRAHLAATYGITPEEFSTLLARQGGACAICRSPDPRGTKTMQVDHDHKTGAIRGLLCHPCNTALGMFGDNAETLRAAVEYLAR